MCIISGHLHLCGNHLFVLHVYNTRKGHKNTTTIFVDCGPIIHPIGTVWLVGYICIRQLWIRQDPDPGR